MAEEPGGNVIPAAVKNSRAAKGFGAPAPPLFVGSLPSEMPVGVGVKAPGGSFHSLVISGPPALDELESSFVSIVPLKRRTGLSQVLVTFQCASERAWLYPSFAYSSFFWLICSSKLRAPTLY